MLKKQSCNICGKKLSDGICADCGIQQRYIEANKEGIISNSKKIGQSAKIWIIISLVLIALPIFMNTTIFESLIYDIQNEQIITTVPNSYYSDVLGYLSNEGDSFEISLDAGNYIVGIDIPEGVYKINVVDRNVNIRLIDEYNQIDFYSWLGKESLLSSSYLDNLRLYQGAILYINDGSIKFTSSNAQVDKLEMLPTNDSLEGYEVYDGAVAGADFPEGTYDVVIDSLDRNIIGRFHAVFPIRYTGLLGLRSSIWSEKDETTIYRNVEFPKGTFLEISNAAVLLQPSGRNSLHK
ncbi:MAG: hypothetical protein ACK5L6_11050 [Anaerorhabdus sp.]|uniref:hypothetical protein n=1 Tax=Anaerorhabdus sp. TaxID=1872524 RepID=UPI003A8BC674